MRHPARLTTLFTLLICAAGSAFAQSATDFYLALLKRGTTEVEAERYATAISPLRISAFGLVEFADHYQTAQIYLAIANDRTSNAEAAREAVRRVVAAERVGHNFASLKLPASIRSAFDGVAKKHLSATEVSALASGNVADIPKPPSNAPKVTTTNPPATQTPANPAPSQSKPTPPRNTNNSTTTTAPNTTPAQTLPKPAPTTQQPATQPQTSGQQATQQPATSSSTQQPATSSSIQQPTPKPATPKPAPPQPQPKPATTTPATTTTTTTTTAPAQTKPAPLSAKDVASRIASADRALSNAQLTEARRIYRELVESPGLDRDSLLRVAEGFYRARDFAGALSAFRTLGALKRGEEPYGYYLSVSLYETGSYDAAKKELTAAIPFIEMTPDVVRYRAKIEGATH